jgi:hypothetical protein
MQLDRIIFCKYISYSAIGTDNFANFIAYLQKGVMISTLVFLQKYIFFSGKSNENIFIKLAQNTHVFKNVRKNNIFI